MSDEVIFKELPETFPKFDNVPGGVPGGLQERITGAIMGSILSANTTANPLPVVAPPPLPAPPPKAAAPAEPVRVGGVVREPSTDAGDPDRESALPAGAINVIVRFVGRSL